MPIQEAGEKVIANVERVIVGKHEEVRLALVALLCQGHLLIEDVPGTGKTVLAKAIARSLGCSFRRIQFTPDMLPSDVTGLSIFNQKTQEFEFRPGPIMAQIVLADEINRATPKTQSALLECMEERQATIDGTTYPMPSPFLVIATQNPIEYEGTFALPEAQLDRFMLRLRLGYPAPLEEIVILDEQKRAHPLEELGEAASLEELQSAQSAVREVYVDSTISDYIVRLVNATRTHPDVYLGASPRGSLALYRAGQAYAALHGRDYVIPDDVKAVAEPAIAHRLIMRTAATIRDVEQGTIVRELLESVPIESTAGQIDPASGRPERGGARTVLRRLPIVIVGGALLIAAFSTGAPFLFFLVYLGILVIGGAYVVTRFGLADLEAGYALDRVTAAVGETLRVTYTVRNAERIPKLWLELHNPTTLPVPLPGRALALGPRAERAWAARVPLSARGHFRVDPLVIRTGDPFGLFEASATVGTGTAVTVYPRVEPLPRWRLPASTLEGSSSMPERTMQTTPLVTSVRPYAPGDAYNRIHWKSTARQGELQVKEFDLEQTADLWIILDLDRHVQAGVGDESTLESAVRVAASLAAHALLENRAVGMTIAAQRITTLPADRGGRQNQKIMSLLAAVGADGSSPLVETILAAMPRIRRGMTAVVITPSVDRAWVRPLGTLRGRGISTAVCLLDRAAYDAFGRRATGREAAAPEVLEDQERTARAMRHALAEHDVTCYPVVPATKLGELLVGRGPVGAGVRV